jgi:hypothetical protein
MFPAACRGLPSGARPGRARFQASEMMPLRRLWGNPISAEIDDKVSSIFTHHDPERRDQEEDRRAARTHRRGDTRALKPALRDDRSRPLSVLAAHPSVRDILAKFVDMTPTPPPPARQHRRNGTRDARRDIDQDAERADVVMMRSCSMSSAISASRRAVISASRATRSASSSTDADSAAIVLAASGCSTRNAW